MISILLFACAAKTIVVGSIDIADEKICVVQLLDDTILEIESELCKELKEGDIIQISRARVKSK